ncbi:MAG: translocation/assembly module TamB domain-containing protein [Methylobacter sp.]
MKRALLIILLVLLLIPAALLALLGTETGSRWLVRTALNYLPAQASVESIDGRLLDRIVLSGLHYRSDSSEIAVNTIVLAWQPAKLFSGTLKINDIIVNNVDINIIKSVPPSEKSRFDVNAKLRIPLDVELDNLLLTGLSYRQGDSRQQLQKLHLAAFTENNQLNLSALELDAKPLAATAKGCIGLGQGFPMDLSAAWQAATEQNGLWQATTTASGDLNRLAVGNRLSSPFKAELHGNLEHLTDNPHIAVRGDWQNLRWPVTSDKPNLSSESGWLEVSGLLSDYQIKLNGQLTQPYLPLTRLAFDGRGSAEAMTIKELALISPEGQFQVKGRVGWKNETTFDLTAAGQNFNPAIVAPQLPGSLNFDARVNGRMAGQALQLDAGIDKLTGKLRNTPVSAGGKLALTDKQLAVDALRVVSGPNKIALNGTLGTQQSALTIAIDAPDLAPLWPSLGGNLKGNGRMQGDWHNPSVQFQAGGRNMRFANYSAGQLNADIDYRPEAASKIQLSVNSVNADKIQITKLQLDGSGTLEQHLFNTQINSSVGDLFSTLSGRYKAEAWQGDFSKLDLNSKDAGNWRLANDMRLHLAKKASGMDAVLTRSCLIQQSASLCVQGNRPANGDFQFKANAANLPTSLAQAFMPGAMQLQGLINADADMRRQNNALSGTFRMTMPANAKVKIQSPAPVEFTLGSWSVDGKLQAQRISADFDLGLTGQDFLRGQLQVGIGPSKTLNGRINASMVNFAALNPFVPQLSNIKGDFKADLALQGRTDQPIVDGSLRFAGGSVDIAQAGLSIHDINLQALPSGNSERIQLSGSAKSGQGSIRLDGYASPQGTADLTLGGNDFEVVKLPDMQVAVSPDLNAQFTPQQRKISGKIAIPKAIVQMPQLPENAIKVSGDQVIIGQQPNRQTKAPPVPVDADVDIELGKQVNFSGQGLKADLTGKLKLTKTGDAMAMYGNIDMDKARYTSYGQDLTVRKGRIQFNGPVDKPWLDVEAVRVSKDKNVTAILGVTGPLDAPKTHLSSEPPLPEEEVLAYLITGGPLNQVSQQEGSAVASAALSLGASKASWLAKKLGVSEFSVEQGTTLQDTLANVGQYLTPNFYVGTKIGLFNQQAFLVLKRKLGNSFNIETQTGTSQRVKINYEKDTD